MIGVTTILLLIPAAVQPIQARKYSLGHELTLSVGSMPVDPFDKGWSVGLSYTVHFDPTWAWELVNASAAYLVATSLRENLIANFGRRPDDFAAPRAMLTTGLVVTPFYGKLAFLDDAVLHQAFFAGLHGGVVFGARQTVLDTVSDVRPALGLGLGYRIFVSEAVSIRLDVRDFVSYRRKFAENDPARFEQVLIVSIALAFSSRGDG
jgi:outer membrane beta-barrel protein